MRKLLMFLALAAVACGGSSSSSKKVPKVALFIDTAYVDYSVGDTGSEASNMEGALAAMSGVTTTTCTTSDIETVVSGKNVFVLPEQEVAEIAPDIDASGRALIYDFVHNKGGELIMAYPDDGALALINDTFSYSLANVDVDADPTGTISITTAATGTSFAGGAATLDSNDATTVVAASSLPGGAKVIYADENGDAAVAVIHNGSGNIILLGWDWYDAMPVGSQDGGWVGVFEAAVHY
jgi:hypothetical protein